MCIRDRYMGSCLQRFKGMEQKTNKFGNSSYSTPFRVGRQSLGGPIRAIALQGDNAQNIPPKEQKQEKKKPEPNIGVVRVRMTPRRVSVPESEAIQECDPLIAQADELLQMAMACLEQSRALHYRSSGSFNTFMRSSLIREQATGTMKRSILSQEPVLRNSTRYNQRDSYNSVSAKCLPERNYRTKF
eukprot:TRINITY_DN22035_c0_g1_i1.p1 TRINITY_DN22035_c0_g1~~TRINITY_DN22035_c0_g1_i1.p1  ORF type:complete len:187 (+),score=21.86 TRINITY_DN22035_c0_g1_i1:66-626(+)